MYTYIHHYTSIRVHLSKGCFYSESIGPSHQVAGGHNEKTHHRHGDHRPQHCKDEDVSHLCTSALLRSDPCIAKIHPSTLWLHFRIHAPVSVPITSQMFDTKECMMYFSSLLSHISAHNASRSVHTMSSQV